MPDADQLKAYLADRDAPCPGCGYNLRGVVESACPECGNTFNTRALAAWKRQAAETPWPHFLWLLFCGCMLWVSLMTGLAGSRAAVLASLVVGLGGFVPLTAYVVVASLHRRAHPGVKFQPSMWLFVSPFLVLSTVVCVAVFNA